MRQGKPQAYRVPDIWGGDLGEQLRGNGPAQVIALYLSSSPHANILGFYRCPLAYLAHDLGFDMETAKKVMDKLTQIGFAAYDEDTDYVFVYGMCALQIKPLKAGDTKVVFAKRMYQSFPESPLKLMFYQRYSEHLRLELKPSAISE